MQRLTRPLPVSLYDWRARLSGTNIGSPTRVFGVYIRRTFDDGFNLETSGCKRCLHFIKLKEHKIEGHGLVPPFIKMEAALPAVERQQEGPAGAQDAIKLS